MTKDLPVYTPESWHWLVAETGRVWSFAAAAYAETTTAPISRIGNEEELGAVLAAPGLESRSPPTLPALEAYAAARRWSKKVGGITVAGIQVPTDDRAKVLRMGPPATSPTMRPRRSCLAHRRLLTGARFKALFAAVMGHVQACFAAHATVLAGIAAGTITTRTEVDAAFA